jgi:hypothetical protein
MSDQENQTDEKLANVYHTAYKDMKDLTKRLADYEEDVRKGEKAADEELEKKYREDAARLRLQLLRDIQVLLPTFQPAEKVDKRSNAVEGQTPTENDLQSLLILLQMMSLPQSVPETNEEEEEDEDPKEPPPSLVSVVIHESDVEGNKNNVNTVTISIENPKKSDSGSE